MKMSFNLSLEVTSGMPITEENSLYYNYTEGFEATYLYKVLRHPVYMVVLYSFAYVSIMICAIFGNVMVVAVVVRNQGMHTVTNYFIVNLAIADIMVALICLPITLLNNLYVGKYWLYVLLYILYYCDNKQLSLLVFK